MITMCGDNELTENPQPSRGPAEEKWNKASSLDAAMLKNPARQNLLARFSKRMGEGH